MKKIILILPTLKISGGAYEAINFISNFLGPACEVCILVMWHEKNSISLDDEIQIIQLSGFRPSRVLALFQMPIIIFNAAKYLCFSRKCSQVFMTHWSTLWAKFFTHRSNAYVLVQGEEWKFGNAFFQKLIYQFVTVIYRRTRLIAFSESLEHQLHEMNIEVFKRYPIWADPVFLKSQKEKVYDFVFMLRKGTVKRPDLTLRGIRYISRFVPSCRIIVIFTDEEFRSRLTDLGVNIAYAPNKSQIASLFSESWLLLFFSESEGFGLPPLEAMGCGCVPLCRDSIGPRFYMKGRLQKLLVKLDVSVDDICDYALSLLRDKNKLDCIAGDSRDIFLRGLAASKADRIGTIRSLKGEG
jgi:glycosyltransferase involved in cell wall biosynthesis